MATVKVYSTTQHLHVKMLVHYGKLATAVEFTGGKLTTNGTTAATYATSNGTMQRFIEGSTEFKKGVITLQRTIVDGNMARNVATTTRVAKPEANASGTGAIKPDGKASGTVTDAVDDAKTPVDDGEESTKGFERLADAKEWLKEMGVNVDSIIKKSQAEQIAEGMGYQIVWK